MEECKSLQDFLRLFKVSNEELKSFNDNFHESKNSGIKKEVNRLEKEFKDKKELPDALWHFIENRTFEAYSEEISRKYKKEDLDVCKYRFFYRGVSKKDYNLVPGLYRESEKEENFYFHELQVRCPGTLAGLKNFNKLTYMQHYGTPTRLLDITANPLVALYFACEKAFEDDAKVFVFGVKSSDVAYEASDKVQMLAHLQELSKDEQAKLQMLSYIYLFRDKFPQNTNLKYQNSEIERFYYNVQKENNAFQREIVPIDILMPVFV